MMLPHHWNIAAIDSLNLEYLDEGAGEPVVLIHAGVCANFFAPLAAEPALADRFRLLCYHRAGYAGSSPFAGSLSIAQQAAHCHALMRHLGIERAHVVGHSSSAMMALQLALDAPEVVQSLVLLDAARPALPSTVQSEFAATVALPAIERYHSGDKAGAVDCWMQGVCGPDYRIALERALPGAFAQGVTDADAFFDQELPAVQAWSFTADEAQRIRRPALAVVGEKSRPTFHERQRVLLDWLPNVEPYVLPGATHLLHVENSRALAETLAGFFARHSIS